MNIATSQLFVYFIEEKFSSSFFIPIFFLILSDSFISTVSAMQSSCIYYAYIHALIHLYVKARIYIRLIRDYWFYVVILNNAYIVNLLDILPYFDCKACVVWQRARTIMALLRKFVIFHTFFVMHVWGNIDDFNVIRCNNSLKRRFTVWIFSLCVFKVFVCLVCK